MRFLTLQVLLYGELIDVEREYVTCTETSKASDGNALSPTRYLAGHSVQFLSLDTMYLTAALPALPLASRCRSVASALAPLLPRQPQAAARLTAHATCKEV